MPKTKRLLVLLLIAAFVGIAVPSAGASEPASEASNGAASSDVAPAIVFAAASTLVRWHIAAPTTARMLDAAVDGLRRALSKAGVDDPLPSLNATESTAVESFTRRFNDARRRAAGRVSDEELEYEAVRAMTALLNDSHTGFLTPTTYRERILRQQNATSYSGIGILTMRRDGQLYVTRVFPGSPAEAAGMRDFDRIVAVDDEPLLPDREPALRGADGTTVTITVQRADAPDPIELRVTRAMVSSPTVEFAMRENGVGYLRLYRFSRGAATEVRAALEAMIAQGLRALVLDLRGNGGGFVVELNRIADLLLPAQTAIYTTESRADGRQTQITGDHGPVLDPATPIVVLIDRGTGSAAEMLSAALAESQRATVAGQRSAGAVLVSITVALPGGSGLSVSIARVTTAAGTVLERVGVQPTADVDYDPVDLARGVDTQARFAINLGARLAGSTPTAGR